jgi:broad specificity phosphatase PhoE
MSHLRYLTHPQVLVDPTIPVPLWGLSALGRDRVATISQSRALQGTTQIVASAERKAIETAQPIAAALGINLEVREAMRENDRSSTGFLPLEAFEIAASEFFA